MAGVRAAPLLRAQMRRVKRAIKPSLWQRFRVWWHGDKAPEADKARVNAYKVIFRGLRGKSVEANKEKIRDAMKFIASEHVSNKERALLFGNLLRGSLEAGKAVHFASFMNGLSLQDPDKLEGLLTHEHLVEAIHRAAQKGRFLPRILPRRTLSLLVSKRTATKDVIASGLIRAAYAHGFQSHIEQAKQDASELVMLRKKVKNYEAAIAAEKKQAA